MDPTDDVTCETGGLLVDGSGFMKVFVCFKGDPSFLMLKVAPDESVSEFVARAAGQLGRPDALPNRIQLYLETAERGRALDSTASLGAAGVAHGSRLVLVDNALRSALGSTSSSVRAGVSLGSALAITISYTQHRSVPWAIAHGLCSWLYVLYAVVRG